MKKQIDLSVIVTCYNIEHYLKDCLNSLTKTLFPKDDMEILLVDDGSTDKTSQIVDYYAKHYSYFKALHKENGGPSLARNYGMDHASGKYIAFVDGDDIVPPNAYTDLMYTAEVHNSQVVVGFVKRFDNLRCHGSYLHKFAIKDTKINTTLDQTHSLLYDTTTWNKVYLRSFLIKNHIRFIPHIIYEDLPFTLDVHLHSKRTSLIKNVVYYWRWRSQSITQSRNALDNFKSRLSSLNKCCDMLKDAGYSLSDSLMTDFRKKVLKLDLHIFLNNIGDSQSDYIYKAQELIYKFLRDWHLLHSSYIKQLPVKDQLLYYAVKTDNFHLLKKLTYVKNKEIGYFNNTKLTKHYHYEIPKLSANALKHLDFKDNVLSTTQKLTSLNIDKDNKIISGAGMFRIRNVELFKKRFSNNNKHEKIFAELIDVDNNRNVLINFYRQKTPAYKRIFHPKTTWTNSRYEFRFNYQKAAKKLGKGTWMILITDDIDDKYMVEEYLGSPKRGSEKLLPPFAASGLSIINDFNTNWHLTFKVHPQKALENTKGVNWIGEPQVNDNYLYFKAHLNISSLIPVIEFDTKHRIYGQIKKQGHYYQIAFSLNDWPSKYFQNLYQLQLIHTLTNKVIPYVFDRKCNFNNFEVDSKNDILVSYVNRDKIYVSLRLKQFNINKYSLINGSTLQIEASPGINWPSHEWPYNHIKIVMISSSLKRRYVLSSLNNQIRVKGLNLIFQIPLLSKDLKQLNILSGLYHFIIYLPINKYRNIKSGLMINNKYVMKDDKPLKIKASDRIKYQVVQGDNGDLEMNISQPWTGIDKSRTFRALSYTLAYPLMRMLPIRRHTVVFDCYWGSQFSSNEKAIYEYIRRFYPRMKTIWFFNNREIPIDGNGHRVKTNSLKYWYYMATAKYFFQNTNLRDHYFKRNGQIETETLHGTFLKHMGFDEPHFKTASRKVQDKFARRNRRWDYMVVPSTYMKRIASNAFDYHQNIIDSGFPRNDELISNNNHKYIRSIKQKLHIPLDKKVILYAPTYRKNVAFNFPLNLDYLEKKLGSNYVLLVRLHYFIAHSGSFYDNPGFVFDVSDYPDINDLFLISDVMITDYSSVMFDYAYLKRPMIFYPYDENFYLDNRNRGTYLNYDSSMPGPIVKTESGLIRALNNLNNVKHKYHNKLIRFSHRYAQFGVHGDATKQVIHRVLNTNRDNLDQEPDRHVIFNKFWHGFQIKDLQSFLLNYLGQILPKRNIIMFESFFGTKYSDNPKAIYLYVKKHYPKYKLYWNVNREDVPYFKKHHIPYIVRFSYKGIFKQAQAKYWITNCRRPFRWTVPKGTTVLQTWHGTPLKTIGSDVNLVTMPGNNVAKYHRQVYEDNRRWDYLLIPNMYSEHIMPRAFRKNANQLMLTGYPRNDELINATSNRVNQIKHHLGIDPHKKVVLYAPTWRDNEFVKSDEFIAHLHLNLAKFKQHYGNNIVVLVRTHYMISNHLDLSKYKGLAMNVSNYQDIADLYLISDVLITDYSSVMFDYAILKRPIIFFDYDFDNYAKSTRGFYFDFRKIAPGPIVTTTDQVIKKLDPILAGHWHMNDRYRAFINKFTKWMDGKSSARAVHQLFSGHNVHEHYFLKHPFGLPRQVELRDGSSMWLPDKDFTNHNQVSFYGNYDKNNQIFKVIKGMQLQSVSFNELIGMKFVLVENEDSLNKYWVNLDDLIPNEK